MSSSRADSPVGDDDNSWLSAPSSRSKMPPRCLYFTARTSLVELGQLDRAVDGVFHKALFVDQAAGHRLVVVKTCPVASLIERARLWRSRGRPAFTISLNRANCRHQPLKDFRSSSVIGRVGIAHLLQAMALDRVFGDVPLFHQARYVVVRNDHADRAGPSGRFGEDDIFASSPRPSRRNSRRWPRCRPCSPPAAFCGLRPFF